MFWTQKEIPYTHLSDEEQDEGVEAVSQEASEMSIRGMTRQRHGDSRQNSRDTPSATRSHCLAVIIGVVIGSLITYVLPFSTTQSHFTDPFSNGFKTEISRAFGAIEIEEVKFTGGLRFNERGELYRNIDQDSIDYAGAPSADVDEAWDDMVNGRYPRFHLSQYNGVGFHEAHLDPQTGTFELGVDTLHALHCLNRIRKFLDYDYYEEELSIEAGGNGKLHVQHCVDYLRQMLQCKADLTPLPVYWSDTANRTVPDFDTLHTCRNFTKIRAWAYHQDVTAMNLAQFGP